MIWILGSTSNEFVSGLTAFLTAEKRPFVLSTSFHELMFSIESDNNRHVHGMYAEVSGGCVKILETVDLVVNLIMSDDFWQADSPFELEEKKASLWAFLAGLSCPVINKPSAIGFFPWVDLLNNATAAETDSNFEVKSYYYVKGRLVDASNAGIQQYHKTFWAGIQKSLAESRVDLCQLSVAIHGSRIYVEHVTTLIRELSHQVSDAIYKELLR